jgi:hypothetical protein
MQVILENRAVAAAAKFGEALGFCACGVWVGILGIK